MLLLSLSPAKGDNGLVINEKRLVKIVAEDETTPYYEATWSLTFNYDNQGKVIQMGYNYEYTCIWGDDFIKVLSQDGNEIYEIKDWLVQNYIHNTLNTIYTYNTKNRLTKIKTESKYDIESFTLRWDNDKLISVTEEQENTYIHSKEIYDYTFTYDQTCKKGYFPLYMCYLGGDKILNSNDITMVHPELFGLRTKQLPATVCGGPESIAETFAYEFDKDGYISKIIVTSREYEWSYTLTWK